MGTPKPQESLTRNFLHDNDFPGALHRKERWMETHELRLGVLNCPAAAVNAQNLGLFFKGAEHQNNPAIFAHVRDGFGSAAG